jgi:hypothetical protein
LTIKNTVAFLNNSIYTLFEIVERMKFGNTNRGFNIPTFYSELKINTVENSLATSTGHGCTNLFWHPTLKI